jgi:hypothetical protein
LSFEKSSAAYNRVGRGDIQIHSSGLLSGKFLDNPLILLKSFTAYRSLGTVSILTGCVEISIWSGIAQETIMADGRDEDFALKLVGDGISIEKKVSEQVAMAVLAAVASGGAVVAVERLEGDA